MLTEDFAKLFQGRVDAYGRDTGGCYRVAAPIWDQIWERHLRGDEAIGVYPVVNQNLCHWGVVDWDVKSASHKSFDFATTAEAHVAAVNTQKVLRALGATSWIATTRSGGRHLWTFAKSWVPAATMRRALLVACSVAGAPTREVNPKSESLQEGQLGNYVRIEYPGALARPDVAGGTYGGRGQLLRGSYGADAEASDPSAPTHDRPRRGGAGDGSGGVRDFDGGRVAGSQVRPQGRLVLERGRSAARLGSDDVALPTDGLTTTGEDSRVPSRVAITASGQPISLEVFVAEALASRVAPQTLEAIASRYVSTKGSRAIPSIEFDFPAGDLLTLVSRLTATGRSVFTNGPNDGDRSRGMVYLARQAKLSGLAPHEAMALLASAHWNKYRGRADEVKQLRDIVERAWT